MSRYCGNCGDSLRVEKNGAYLFSGDLKKYRHTDALLCVKCDKMVLTGHGAGWFNTPIEMIDLKPRYNTSLLYEHYGAVEKRAVCVNCQKTMDFMGKGILLLEDEHAHQFGKMWVCPHCDYIFIDAKHTGWPPPLTLDEKRGLEDEYAPNIVRVGTGVIPFFSSIKKAEEEEGSINHVADFYQKQTDKAIENLKWEVIEKQTQEALNKKSAE